MGTDSTQKRGHLRGAGHVHRQMYFGGATSTAKKYELLSWSHEELIALDEKMSQKQFHQLIRKKYA
jgi:hypothetical protein